MKKLLKRYTPKPEALKEHKHLGWLSAHLHHPSLWNFNRKSIAKAFAIGLFCAFIPVPFQMLLAAPSAVIFSANLPLSVALVWMTNPLTMPAIFYACYQLGAWLLDSQIKQDFVISLESIWQLFDVIWQPFLLGCFLLASSSALIGYWSVHALYRLKVYQRTKRH